jgi:lipoyl(octanoyl) transferase
MYKWLARPADYASVWRDMQAFTEARGPDTPDEIWLCEHSPVYTLGQAGKPEHVLNPAGIPVVRCDRGGQVTYHGPGQVVVYAMVDLRRAGMYVKEYVAFLEDAVIETLAEYGLHARRKAGAPGVYVALQSAAAAAGLGQVPAGQGQAAAGAAMPAAKPMGDFTAADFPSGDDLAKIAALGIKVRSGCTYHGVAMNVDMDLSPFLGINPCGYENLVTVDMASCGVRADFQQAGEKLAGRIARVSGR